MYNINIHATYKYKYVKARNELHMYCMSTVCHK